jgi:hypothetical protein
MMLPNRNTIFSGCIAAFIAGLVQPNVANAQDANDYSSANNWLCRGADSDLGACDIDLTTTIVNANGRLAIEAHQPVSDAPIDCFYVYPTVSLDATPNSDMEAGPEEYGVISSQFARFNSQCRTFAPMYRQFTLAALRGGAAGADRQLGYNDVLAAWQYYLENYNEGRGVVLVGHSQGSGVLTNLIRNEVDGKPIQQQIISAMLLGTTVQVPAGDVVGGTFKQMPLCTLANQNQCIIVYATFRDTVPPSERALFGRNGSGTVAACTNPALLAKGNHEAHAYLSAAPGGRTTTPNWTSDLDVAETPFVSVPGLLTTDCVTTGSHSYLRLTIHGDESDVRTDDIAGDIMTAEGAIDAGWGLHLLDANVGMGDLLTLVEKQAVTYLGKH